ncbi:hypothetical protein ABE65_006315 [Fictibacillus phosphorivorans]|uniref:Uncharacterized protein n=1 Tax=Fictibacillus phosphorivorans TaxID=1221500 RepID=A0A160IKA1_9BACL|nr:hypothetical protein [Fictibacillus phosphorivorans]ANC76434.1 hypothetical protein ABE65_006315 [Fictibacillus phosphorivorans]
MNENKVEFKLTIQEESKEPSILRLLLAFLIVFSFVFLFVDFDDQSIETQGIARQWGEAELMNNESMKYILLSDSKKMKYIDIISATNKDEQPTYSFKELDQFEYRINKKEYVYKLHYYQMESCTECQKDVWVSVQKEDTGWFVSHLNFSESKAEKKIHNVEAKQIPTSEKQEKELEERKSFIMKWLN